MTIEINGIYFSYEDHGEGIPLVFIHGYPLSKEMWKPQIDGLSTDFRTIAFDLRGHGGTQAIATPYSMDMLAEDCVNLLDRIHVNGPAIICGLSMGGYVSMAIHNRFPERVAGLVFAATRAGNDSPEAQLNRDKAAQLARQQGSEAIAASMLPKMFAPETYTQNPELVNQLRSIMIGTSVDGIVGALMAIKNRSDFTAMLPLIKVPTLVIHGTDDQLIPATEAQSMHSKIPGSALELVPNAGHILNLERPDQFNQAIKSFFRPV